MIQVDSDQPVRISVGEDGGWRVQGTRVPVEVILQEFHAGATPEQIHEDYPSAPLADIYNVLSYCLSHMEVTEAYLKECGRIEVELRDRAGASTSAPALRARLRSMQTQRR